MLALGVVVTTSTTTLAHTQGVSLANVNLTENGKATLELGFATAEISRLVPIDSDHDGRVSGSELARVRDSLVKILPGTFELRADGKPCPAKVDLIKLAEPADGIDVIVAYTCAPRPRDVVFRSHLAPAMAPGHRLVSSLATPSRTQSRVLTSSEPEVSLITEWEPDDRKAARIQYGIAAAIGVAAVVAFALRKKTRAPTS